MVKERDYYIEQHRLLHEQGKFKGKSLAPWVETIRDLIEIYSAKSMLDFGCGKATFYPIFNILYDLYDPGWEPYSEKPSGKFDAVICTDVMEHIPESGVDYVLDDLEQYATKFVFLTICTRAAEKNLPDGSNAHVTIKPPRWWRDRIGDRTVPFHAEFI